MKWPPYILAQVKKAIQVNFETLKCQNGRHRDLDGVKMK